MLPRLSLASRLAYVSRLRETPLFKLADFARDQIWYTKAMLRGSFAQHGEDRFLSDYFQGRPGIYIDVGANHPFKISNTYALYRSGWNGLTVEPIGRLVKAHRRYRPRDIQIHAGVGAAESSLQFFELTPGVLSTFDEAAAQYAIQHSEAVLRRVTQVPVTTLAALTKTHLLRKTVDLLSIDVEGGELSVLQGWDWDGHPPPRLILCETQRLDGASRREEVEAFLAPHGYGWKQSLGCNDVYEHRT